MVQYLDYYIKFHDNDFALKYILSVNENVAPWEVTYIPKRSLT